MDEHLLRFDTKSTFCFIDLETENLCLHLEQNLPWQCAMLQVRGDSVFDDYTRYIKWHRPPNVSVGAAEKTRFQPEMVTRTGTDYKEVLEKVIQWTTEADYIIGHNVLGFDMYFISAFYRMMGKSPVGLAEKTIDTHALAKGLKISDVFDRKKCSLLEYQYRMIHTIARGVKTNMKVLGQEMTIDHNYDMLHDALVDLTLNLKIWNKLKHQVAV